MNTLKSGWFSGGAGSFVKLAGTMTALGALLTVTARSSGELAASGAQGAGGTAAQAPTSEPGSPAGGTGAIQPAVFDESVRAFAARIQAQRPADRNVSDGAVSQVQEDFAASPAPAFMALNTVVNLSAVPSALTTYPLSADGKYYNVNLLNRNFLPPTAHATFSSGVSQLGAAGPQFVFDGGDTAFTATAATPGDPNVTVILTVDMGQYFSIGGIRPLYQPLGGGDPVSQRIRLATKLGPQADWQTVVQSPVAAPDVTLSFDATPARYLELTMFGNGCNLLELFVYPSAQTAPPPTYASGYDVTSLASTQSVNENFYPMGTQWPVSWPAGGFRPKSPGTGDAVATVDLGAQYPISRVTASFFWSVPWANGGRLEMGATPEAYTILRDSGPGHDFGLSLNFPFSTQPVRYLRATDYFIPSVGLSQGVLWSLHAFATPSPHVAYYPLSADGKYFEVNLLRRPTGDVQPTASVVYSNGALPFIFDPLGRIAANALDGDDLSFSWSAASGTFSDATATLTVDLGQVQSIGAVRQLFYGGFRPLSSSLRVAQTLAGPWQPVLENTPVTAADNTSSFDSASARYVELTMKGTTSVAFVHLLELRVYPANATDPAPSSGSHLDLTYLTGMTPVVNANMGRAIAPRIHSVAGASGYYVKTAAQGGTGDATVTVDLGQQYQISEIVLSWFANGIWPAGGKIDVDDGSGNWVTVFDSGPGTPLGPAADGAQRLSFAPRAARSVRLTGYFDPAAAPAGLLEGIEVFGDNVPCVANSACSESCPCDAGVSTCASDSECKAGLVCGPNNGRRFDRPGGTSVCWDPKCSDNPSTLSCGTPVSSCGRCSSAVRSCDDDHQCVDGEVCGSLNSVRFGRDVGNVCWPAICETQPNSSDHCGSETATCGRCDCSASCAAKQCGDDPADGCGGICRGLCATGQAGCETDMDCSSGNVCGIGVGDRFGLPASANVCWPTACTLQDPSKPNCGVGNAQCGACPACVPQCDGESTGPDGCGGFCGECAGIRLNGQCAAAFPGDTAEFPIPLQVGPTTATGALPGFFQVTDRGTAAYSIPIAVPPGRMGMEPELSLNYSSTKANGILGLGWSLGGLSSITRCSKIVDRDSATEPVKLDGTDTFCLDGQALVQLPNGRAYGDEGAEYRTEIDSFRKVVSHQTGAVAAGLGLRGPDSFEVRSKDGRILTYGGSDDSVVIASDVAVGRVWGLSKVADRSANIMKITYTPSRAVGIGLPVPNGGIRSPDGTVELLPSTISYGEVSGVMTRFVAFSYEDRHDVIKHFASGSAGYALQRLTEIKTLVGAEVVKTYHIKYQEPFSQHPIITSSHVTSINECAVESGGETCLPATTFSYGGFPDQGPPQTLTESLHLEAGSAGTLQNCLDFAGGVHTQFDPNGQGAVQDCFANLVPRMRPRIITGDFNGDGRDDILGSSDVMSVGDSGLWTRAISQNDSSTSSETTTFGVTTSTTLDGMTPNNRCINQGSVMDVNRDGRADLVVLCNDGGGPDNPVTVLMSEGGGFSLDFAPRGERAA